MFRGAVGHVLPHDLRSAITKLCHRHINRRKHRRNGLSTRLACLNATSNFKIRDFCAASTDPAVEQVAETVEISITDPRTLRFILKLQKNVDGIPDAELDLLTSALSEQYQLQPGSISIRSPASRRRSLREWHILITFESSTVPKYFYFAIIFLLTDFDLIRNIRWCIAATKLLDFGVYVAIS
jgi:hypothetical protein